MDRTTEAISEFLLALELCQPGDTELQSVSNRALGNLYRETGQYQKAHGAMAHAHAAKAAETPRYKGGFATLETVVGTIYSAQGEHGQALAAHQRALRLWESSPDGGPPGNADVERGYIGGVLLALGDTAGAIDHLRRAAAGLEALGKSDTVNFARILHTWGDALRAQGGLPHAALVHLDRALAIRRRLLPAFHKDIAATLRLIAAVNDGIGNTDAASKARDEAAAISRRSQVACAGPGCERRLREDGAPLDVCVTCRRTFYCGKACQTADWKPRHKAECKALVAEAAAATSQK